MRVISLTLALATLVSAAAISAVVGRDARPRPRPRTSPWSPTRRREAFGKIIGEFTDTAAGDDASFTQLRQPGTGALRDRGLPADVVALSLQPDMSTSSTPASVPKTWNKNKYKGMVTQSIVVFVVRDDNPKKICGWADPVKPGIEVITPNLAHVGGARWNIMAAYGAQRKQGKTHKQAVAYLNRLIRHVPVMDKSAREALQTFAGGKRDVLTTYENEAIFANKKECAPTSCGHARRSSWTTDRADADRPAEGRGARILRYLYTGAAQRIFAENGYRPIVKSVRRQTAFPNPKGMFKIAYVGGWPKVQKQFFNPRNGIVSRMIGSLGK